MKALEEGRNNTLEMSSDRGRLQSNCREVSTQHQSTPAQNEGRTIGVSCVEDESGWGVWHSVWHDASIGPVRRAHVTVPTRFAPKAGLSSGLACVFFPVPQPHDGTHPDSQKQTT